MTEQTINVPLPAPNSILHGPILRTLTKLAFPNTIAMMAAMLVSIAETVYIGRLGIEPLAAIAVVFPFVVLMAMMSTGAMGGGVSSAVSRALGAGDTGRAATLAAHAILIGLGGGLLFTVIMLAFGEAIFSLLGARGKVLEHAVAYAQVAFAGAIFVWLSNTLASVLRGAGNMKLPSIIMLATAALQVTIGGVLGLGLFGFPQFGMRGVAAGQAIAFAFASGFLAWYFWSGRGRVKLTIAGVQFQRGMFVDILKVGAVACLSPLQSVATVLIFTNLLAAYGATTLAGYGIGSRLEFMLVPISFSIGVASVPMVGMNIGAGNFARARRVAWTAGLLSAAILGTVGIILSLMPDLWSARFTDNAEVLAAAGQYFRMTGPAFPFLGLALCLYFASQGSGKILGPVLAQSGRLVTVALGGWLLVSIGAPGWTLFALAGASMVLYGLLTALSVWLTAWGPPRLAAA